MKRRDFVKRAGAGFGAVTVAVAVPNVAHADGHLPKVAEDDTQAQALKYEQMSTEEGKMCMNCQLYQGKEGKDWGPCLLFPGKEVAAKGYCSAWVLKG